MTRKGIKVIYTKRESGALDVPSVFIDGKRIGLMRKVELSTDAERLVTVLRLERVLCGEDQVVTLTEEDLGRWQVECRYLEFLDYVKSLPVSARKVRINTEKDPTVPLTEIACGTCSLRIGTSIFLELQAKYGVGLDLISEGSIPPPEEK